MARKKESKVYNPFLDSGTRKPKKYNPFSESQIRNTTKYYTRVEGDKCIYCGEEKQCMDHVLPVKAFQKDPFGWYHPDIMQVVPCCNSCNLIAGNRVFERFQEKHKYIIGIILDKNVKAYLKRKKLGLI